MMPGRGRVATGRVIIALSTATLIVLALLIGNLIYSVYSQNQKAELHPVALFLQPASPVERGQPVKVTAKVINTGAVGADAFNVAFSFRPLGGEARWTAFATVTLPGLALSDQATEVAVTLDTAAAQLNPGSFQIRVLVDSEGQIPELDETNNELITGLTIAPSRLGEPDLLPISLQFASPVTQDQQVALRSKILNAGTRDAGAFTVSFSLCPLSSTRSVCRSDDFKDIPAKDPRTSQTAFSGLVQGGTLDASIEFSASGLQLAPGTYQVRVFVDPPTAGSPQGQVPEQDESNNILIEQLNIQGAELHPIGVRFDKSFVRLGDEVNVLVNVENSGNATASDFEIAFFINGKEFARPRGTLEGGHQAEFQGTLKTSDPALNLTSNVANTIEIIVDPTNRIPELDETNNVLQTGITLQAAQALLSELHPIAIELTPPSPLERGRDASVTIRSVIENSGKIAANGFNVEIAYRPAVGVRWIPIAPEFCTICRELSLEPGANLTVQGQLALRDLNLAAGIYEVRVLVDPEEAVSELDKTNNEMITTLSLLAPRLPNLVVTDLKLDLANVIARRGQLVRVLSVVENQGDQDAGPFIVQFARCRIEALPGTPNVQNVPCTSGFSTFAEQSVTALTVGQRVAVIGTLDTTNLTPGTYLIRVTADPATPSAPFGSVSESNETDNSNLTVMLIAGPDLIVQGLNLTIEFAPENLLILPTPTVQMTQGERAKVSAQIANIGLEDAGAFDVRFSLCPVSSISASGQPVHQNCIPFGTQSFIGLGRNLPGGPPSVSADLDTSSVAPGLYDVLVEADPPTPDQPFGLIAEQVESNNSQSLVQTFFKSLEILPPPDLVPTSLVLNPQGPLVLNPQGPRTPVEAFVQVENHGAGPALRPFIVRFTVRLLTPLPPGATGPQAQEQSFDDQTLSGLAAGGRAAAKGILNTANLPAGSYEICAQLDPPDGDHPRGHIPEQDETNNRLCVPPAQQQPATGGSLPDMRPLTILLTPPDQVDKGQLVKIAVTLTNSGGQAAGPFRVDFLIRRTDIASGAALTPFAQAVFNGLSAGETTMANATLQTITRSSGDYEIVAIVDAGNQVTESNEANNQISATLTIH